VSASDKAYKNARRFRRELSLPEKLLWARIKSSGVRIRRQHPLGAYVLDFYYPAGKLAIEIDGAAHDFGDRPDRDEMRTRWLNDRGIDVVRIPARDVLADPNSVADALLRLCAKPLHHSALPSGPPPHACGAGRSE
jgi:very-short-patch-repair endonuclease